MVKCIHSGCRTAEENMQMDRELLQQLEQVDQKKEAILHLYEWKGASATYGHFVKPEDFLNLEGVKNNNINLARRPTGGGIIFHLTDFAFSILVPSSHSKFSINTMDNYSLINEIVIEVVEEFLVLNNKVVEKEFLFKKEINLLSISDEPEPQDLACARFCMAKPTRYDVMLKGKKVGGAAQRRTKSGFLHQGSICLSKLSENFLSEVLKEDSKVLQAMDLYSYPLLGSCLDLVELNKSRRILETLFEKYVQLRLFLGPKKEK